MSDQMLRVAAEAAYGKDAVKYIRLSENTDNEKIQKKKSEVRTGKIVKSRNNKTKTDMSDEYKIGDSVVVYPDKKIGIVCEPVNDKGILRVQVADRKFYINHKRVKLKVSAKELYPDDYDLSIVFDSVKNRKIRHDMGRKLTDEVIVYDKDE